MKSMKVLTLVVIFIIVGVGVFYWRSLGTDPEIRQGASLFQEPTPADDAETPTDIPLSEVVASNIEIPWGMVFLPDGSLLFTERPGRVKMIDTDGNLRNDPLLAIADVRNVGEGGLLGIEVHPDFHNMPFIYLYYTYSENQGRTLNRVVRYRFVGGNFSDRMVIVDNIPGAANHNGGRIKFGPDKLLYITAGDAQDPSLSQDINSLAGKILRVADNGSVPAENMSGTFIYSYGHRNPQGLAWDNEGRLWSTEHGPVARDELNLIEEGGNYGWPTIVGDQTGAGMIAPVIHSGSGTWAPSGAAYFQGSIFFTGLRGEALYEAEIGNVSVELKQHFKGELGRIRDVIVGPDNLLYIATGNTDGRGRPRADDDRIMRINPRKL